MNSPGIVAGPPAFLFKAPRQLMLWAAVVYSAGMVAGVYAWRRALWWIVAVAMFIAAAAYFANRRSGLAWLLAFGTFFPAGALHIQMDSARPAFAIISVGSGNSFGLPRYETLARLAAAGTRVYRTDLDGAVTFYLDGHSVKAASTGPQSYRCQPFRRHPRLMAVDENLRSASGRFRHPARAPE